MNEIVPVENCTGCSACYALCPQDAITMIEDQEGFLFPSVDLQECTSCGQCVEKCPVINASSYKSDTIPVVYAGWTNDPQLLRQSTSGGAFSEIARGVLQSGGVVFGAAFDESMVVRHMGVDNWDGIEALRGSKYVQSNVGETYHLAEAHLKSGRPILYSGTPCQIAGLKAFLGKDYENLLTCDLICHGVPSPIVFRKALEVTEKQHKSKIADFKFREKSFGWLYPTVYIKLSNNKKLFEHNLDNHFNLGFLKNIYLRTSCYQCPIKSIGSNADITLGDFWQLIKYQPSLINRNGTSAILANTKKGHEAILQCSERLELTECPFAYVEKDSNLRKSVNPSPEREAFFADFDRLPFEELAKKYMKPRGGIMRWIALARRKLRRWVWEWR